MKALLLVVALLLPVTGAAAGSSRASLAGFKEARSHRILPLNHFFLNTLPLPVLTDSLGLSLEVVIIPKLTLFGGFEHEESAYNSNLLQWIYGSDVDVNRDSYFIGGRYYLHNAAESGWYAGGGHRLGSVKTSAYTAYNHNDDKSENFSGPYAEAGYRFLIGDFHRLTWLGDLNIGYGPGEVSASKDSLGYERVKVGYNAGLEARLGISF